MPDGLVLRRRLKFGSSMTTGGGGGHHSGIRTRQILIPGLHECSMTGTGAFKECLQRPRATATWARLAGAMHSTPGEARPHSPRESQGRLLWFAFVTSYTSDLLKESSDPPV